MREGTNGFPIGCDSVLRLLLGLSAAALCALPARAADPYSLTLENAPPGTGDDLKKLVGGLTRGRPIATAAALRHAGRDNAERVQAALVAAGYYRASVAFRLDEQSGEPAGVLAIDAGEKFSIAEHAIVYQDAIEALRPSTFEEAELDVSDDADGAALKANQERFLAELWERGYPAAEMVARRAETEASGSEARAVYTFKSGPQARFGDLRVTGADQTNTEFIENFAPWRPGDVVKRSELLVYRDRLAETGLFSSIEADFGAISPDGDAPVLLTVSERKRRTVGVGASYSTSEGLGGRLFLEYRNLFGRAETARAEIAAAAIEQSVTLKFTKPVPAFPGAAFADAAFANETNDAYDARSVNLAGGLFKTWAHDRLETRGGVAIETSKVESKLAAPADAVERTYFVSIPVSIAWDTEDDPLLLTRGVRASLAVAPHFGSQNFTRIEALGRTRVNFGDMTLAGRARLAATAGQSLAALPVNKRAYAGGGSSVRGYGYQEAGPLDASGAPIGGRSAVEFGLEGRAKLFGDFQGALFADAGAAFPSGFPDFDGEVFVGAGAGLRYLSPLGPVRLDIAMPFKRRPTDRAFHIYISLGQPF